MIAGSAACQPAKRRAKQAFATLHLHVFIFSARFRVEARLIAGKAAALPANC